MAIEHGDWIEDGMIRGPIVGECLLTKRDIPCWTIRRANGNRGYIPKSQACLWFKKWEAQWEAQGDDYEQAIDSETDILGLGLEAQSLDARLASAEGLAG